MELDHVTQSYFENLESTDKNTQYEAFNHILTAVEKEVDWSYEVWDRLKEDLTHSNNHRRARAAQFLAGLAKSDPEKRMLNDFPALWEVTKDHKFVTARHCLQSIWRVGLAGPDQKAMVIHHLIDRFNNCKDEKNHTLIRFDIIQGLRKLYDAGKDKEIEHEEIKQKALELIETEEESKYQKKYAAVWDIK